MCQNSNRLGLAERFVQVHASVPGISRSSEAYRKLNCSTERPDHVLTQARPTGDLRSVLRDADMHTGATGNAGAWWNPPASLAIYGRQIGLAIARGCSNRECLRDARHVLCRQAHLQSPQVFARLERSGTPESRLVHFVAEIPSRNLRFFRRSQRGV